ncbi:MAG: hypothetical protein HYX72_15050 [Acidobacteria bacterium]|nr:hypothetical protein [Acidobacteriota bacterium]
MEERDFYTESEANHPATLSCPFCRTAETYDLKWIVRKKKDSLPSRANSDDKARFAHARSYMVRKDDVAFCKNMRCRKRFEVSGIQSVVLL